MYVYKFLEWQCNRHVKLVELYRVQVFREPIYYCPFKHCGYFIPITGMKS